MLVRDVMTRPAPSLPVAATVDEAIRRLADDRIASLPVIDDAGRVVGVVSESDLLRAPLEHDPRAHARVPAPTPPRPHAVEEVMTRHPFTTYEGADVAEIAAVFAERGWKSIPVVAGGRLVATVSRSELLRALARSDAAIEADVRVRLAMDGPPGCRAEVREAEVIIHGVGSARDARLAEAAVASVRGVRRVVVPTPAEAPWTAADADAGRS